MSEEVYYEETKGGVNKDNAMDGDSGVKSPSIPEILSALQRIETSDVFIQSERLKSFLRYVVTETIEGRSDRIKAYAIKLEVFNGASEDEAIVRTTAARLRHALERYYATAKGEVVVISIPKGKYIPTFSYTNKSNDFLIVKSEETKNKYMIHFIYIIILVFILAFSGLIWLGFSR